METKYSEKQVKRAFDMVTDKRDWKDRIDYWIRKRDHDVVEEAIKFYTKTEMIVVESTSTYERIVSIGYRMGPDGDH